ncbi:MAG: TIR domain-containing protein [Acidimicrobiales bacterium]
MSTTPIVGGVTSPGPTVPGQVVAADVTTPTADTAPGRPHHDVFVCYASEDKAVADAVVGTLEQGGVRCWIAPRDVTPGERWAVEILRGIRGAAIVVFVLSSHSNASPHVSRELERAVSEGLVVLPLRIEDVMPSAELEYYISSAHWLDALTPPLRAHLGRLLETVRFLLAERRSEPPPVRATASPSASAPTPSPPSTSGVLVVVLAVVAALLVLVAAALAVVKVRSTEPPASTSTTASSTSVTSSGRSGRQVRIADIQVGDCFNLPPESAQMAYVIVVDCGGYHDVTFYAELTYPSYAGQDYPGMDQMNDYARDRCETDFQRIFTDPDRAARLITQPIVPTESSWPDGDRRIECLAWEPAALTGTTTIPP